jgi:hypothetical protein
MPADGSDVLLLLLLFCRWLVANSALLGAVVAAGWASCRSGVELELLLLLLLCSSRAASSACLTGPARVAVGVCCRWPEFTAQLLLLLPAVGSSALLLAMFRLPLSLEALLLEVRLQRTLDE